MLCVGSPEGDGDGKFEHLRDGQSWRPIAASRSGAERFCGSRFETLLYALLRTLCVSLLTSWTAPVLHPHRSPSLGPPSTLRLREVH